MTLQEIEDKWNRSRLSPLGKELWDSFPEGEWFYPQAGNGYMGDEHFRIHVEHRQTKIRIAMNFQHDVMSVYGEHGPTWSFVLTKTEQKILLKRFRESANKALAFQFQIAPFRNESPF
jgi:hypothetical protein